MEYWFLYLIIILVCPVMMIAFGKQFKNKAPKEINSFYGYRTRRSMKNQDTWRFAHHCFGNLWLRAGIATLPLSVLVMLFSFGKDMNTIANYALVIVVIQLIPMMLPIILVELKLKQTFDEYGRRK